MKKRILCIAVVVCMALCVFAGCSGDDSGKALSADISQADFYNLAREQRFDYVPLFDKGLAPTNSAEYLMYAFVLDDENIKAQSEGNAQMSAEYVQSVITSHFEVAEDKITHGSLFKTWDYDSVTGIYTAVPSGYNEEPAYKLVSAKAASNGGKTEYTVTATPIGIEELFYLINSPVDFAYESGSKALNDFHALLKDSGVYVDGMTYSDAIVAIMEAGRGNELPDTKRTDTFTYYVKDDGAVVFIAHEVNFEAPSTHGGVAIEK